MARKLAKSRQRVRKVRNGARRVRSAGRLIKRGASWGNRRGGVYRCKECNGDIKERRRKEHQHRHEMARQFGGPHQHPKGTTPQYQQRRPTPGSSPASAAPQPRPAPSRPASKSKTTERNRRSGTTNGDPMARNGSGPSVGGSGQTIGAGFSAWAGQVPSDLPSLEASLKGGSEGLKAGAGAIEEYVQGLMAIPVHPAVVGPLQRVVDALQETSSEFLRAYQIFERVYEHGIAHANQSGPKPKDNFFAGTGA